MPRTPKRRKRGVILKPQGLDKLQRAKSEAEIKENNCERYTLQTLSDRTGLDAHTLNKIDTGSTGVDKRSLVRYFRAFNLSLEPSDYCQPTPEVEELESSHNTQGKIHNCFNWGEAPDVSTFFGRTAELTTLKRWIVEENCRLVEIFGTIGIGKTYLSVKLALELQNEFECLIWQSLSNAPPLEELFAGLLQVMSEDAETDLPENLWVRISQLLRYLREHRCLLILDGVEAILQESTLKHRAGNYAAGNYRQGYEAYGELLRQVGETPHQSCLMLTTQKNLKEIGLLEGECLPVRIMPVKGLPVEEAQKILGAKDSLSGSITDWSRLINFYAGNPLMLQIASKTIKNLFDGSIAEFLTQKTLVFGEICHRLKQQFQRLSEAEKEIIKWLASSRQPISFCQLREQLLPSVSPPKLLEALESLKGRSLIEVKDKMFFLLPIMGEYLRENILNNEVTIHSLPKKSLTVGAFSNLEKLSEAASGG